LLVRLSGKEMPALIDIAVAAAGFARTQGFQSWWR
jgi:hypothetical protein